MLAENSVTPIQQFANTMGKNATDSTLIIDAMDILYTGHVKGFCIVSSDSDFTRLASRLRESGMTVIGMGEEKTPKSFRAACSIFTNLEVLITDDDNQSDGQVATAKKRRRGAKGDGVSKSAVRDAIIDIINENNDQGKPTSLAEVGSRLVNKYPDFDVRNFGYSVLSKFLEEFENLELIKREDSVFVKLSEDKRSQDEVAAFIRTGVEFRGVEGIDLGVLGTMVHEEFPHFNVKDYGFSQFSKFVRAIEGIVIADNENGLDHVYPDVN